MALGLEIPHRVPVSKYEQEFEQHDRGLREVQRGELKCPGWGTSGQEGKAMVTSRFLAHEAEQKEGRDLTGKQGRRRGLGKGCQPRQVFGNLSVEPREELTHESLHYFSLNLMG